MSAGKPGPSRPGQGELCPLGQEGRKGLLRTGEESLGSPGPFQATSTCSAAAPGTVLTLFGHLQGYPRSWAPPASLLAVPPRGTRALPAGTECCLSHPLLPFSSRLEVPGLGKIPHWMENCWPRKGG